MSNLPCYPKITIVTPSYNQGQFIEETICSVLQQNYPNLEYMVIDGGSQDNSIEIIKKYEEFITYWISEPDEGPVDAINKGWSRANGEIISYLNSDDVYLPNTLSTIARAFQLRPSVQAICGNQFSIDQDGFITSISNIEEIDHSSLLRLNYIPQPSTFIRKTALDAVGFLDPRIKYNFDFELWLRLTRTGCIETIPDILAATRWHDQTITVTKRPYIGKELTEIIAHELEQFTKLPTSEKREILSKVNFLAAHLYLEPNKLVESIPHALKAFELANKSEKLQIIIRYILHFSYPIRLLKNKLFPRKKQSFREEQAIHWSSEVAPKAFASAAKKS